MLGVPLALGFVISSIVTFCANRKTLYWALSGIILIAALVPSNSPTVLVITAAVASALVILAVAIVRQREAVSVARPNYYLILFIMYSSSVAIIHEPTTYSITIVLLGILHVGIALIASVEDETVSRGFIFSLVIVVVAQLAITLGEEFFDKQAMWPLTNGSDRIESRLNLLAPSLPGRAMGSTAHPIPLGILAGVAVIVFVLVSIRRYHRKYIFFSTIAFICLVFSGTRSALIGVVIILLVIYLVESSTQKRVLRTIVVFTILILGYVAATQVLASSELQSSESYTHRFAVLSYVPHLVGRGLGSIIFGSGYESIADLLLAPDFSGASGIAVFDQEILRTFVAAGIIGIGLLSMAVVNGLKRGDFASKAVILFIVWMFFSFDVLSWNLTTSILIVALSRPLMPWSRFANVSDLPSSRYPTIKVAGHMRRSSGINPAGITPVSQE